MEVSGKRTGTSAENTEVLCDPCKHDGVNLLAEGYCKNCDEYLCKACYRVHCRPSVTRHHVLQDKDSMPRKRLTKLEICPVHTDQPIEFYCESHEEVCCAKCRSTSHGKCENVKLINDILSQIDMTTEFSMLQQKVKMHVKDIGKTQHLVQTSLKAIAINYGNSREEMDTFRKAVNEHIDKIENELDNKIKTVRNEDEERLTAYNNTCNVMYFDINAVDAYIQDTRILFVSDASRTSSTDGQLRYVHLGEQQEQTFGICEVRNVSSGDRRRLRRFGITTDNSGTIYICDYQKQILVCSPVENNDQNPKKIQVKSEVLIDYTGKHVSPSGIAVCNRSFRLYVGMFGDKIEMYTIA